MIPSEIIFSDPWCGGMPVEAQQIGPLTSAHEQLTTLCLLKRAKGTLPRALLDAANACDEAWAVYDRVRHTEWSAWGEVHKDYIRAWMAGGDERATLARSSAAFDKAGAACNGAEALWRAARAVYVEALQEHQPEIEALHAKECGCKEWNGSEIVFPPAVRQS